MKESRKTSGGKSDPESSICLDKKSLGNVSEKDVNKEILKTTISQGKVWFGGVTKGDLIEEEVLTVGWMVYDRF